MDELFVNEKIRELKQPLNCDFNFKESKAIIEEIIEHVGGSDSLDYYKVLLDVIEACEFSVNGIFPRIKVRRFYYKFLDYISYKFRYIEFLNVDKTSTEELNKILDIGGKFCMRLSAVIGGVKGLYFCFGIITCLIRDATFKARYASIGLYCFRSLRIAIEKFEVTNSQKEEYLERTQILLSRNKKFFRKSETL